MEIIKIEREGKPIFQGKTTAKSFRSWIENKIGVFSRHNNEEYRQVFQEILRAYNYYEPVKSVEVNALQWKGKSSIEIIRGIDRLIVIKYQKETPESEAKEIRTEINKEELNALVSSIKYLNKNLEDEKGIETRDIAYEYCKLMNYSDMLNGNLWKNVFSNRPLHNKLTIALNALQELGFTSYKKGVTKLLNKDISVQLVLE